MSMSKATLIYSLDGKTLLDAGTDNDCSESFTATRRNAQNLARRRGVIVKIESGRYNFSVGPAGTLCYDVRGVVDDAIG